MIRSIAGFAWLASASPSLPELLAVLGLFVLASPVAAGAFNKQTQAGAALYRSLLRNRERSEETQAGHPGKMPGAAPSELA